MTELTQLEQAKQALIALSDHLKEIESRQSEEINLFDAVGMRTQEIKHSAFLAWLFGPTKAHALRTTFLQNFLEQLISHRAPDEAADTYQSNRTILSEQHINSVSDLADFLRAEDIAVVTEKVVHNKESRMDIFIESPSTKTVLVIENKVFTTTHNNQLARYEEELSDRADWRKIYVYLTPLGDAPYDFEEYRDNWCVFSYATVLRIVRDIAKKIPNNKQSARLKFLLEDYIDMVDTNILKGNKELRALCKRIRREHADAIGLLLAYTDNAEAVIEYATTWLKNKLKKITITSNAALHTDFYTENAQQFFGELKNKRIGYQLLYRVTAVNGAISALAFMEKASDETWSAKQLAVANICLNQNPSSDKYCTLFTVPLIDEEDRGEDLDILKERIDDGLRQFQEKVSELESNF